MELVVSYIEKEELSYLLINEASKEGWLFSEYDIDFCFGYDGNKLFSIKVNDELAGCILYHKNDVSSKNITTYSVGLFLVLEKFRGKKIIGPYLWNKAINQHINSDMIGCFNSVPRALGYYEKMGYKKTSLVNASYSLHLKKLALRLDLFEDIKPLVNKGAVKKINSQNLHQINSFNKDLFKKNPGYCCLLKSWVNRPDALVYAFFEKNILTGYGVATLCKIDSEQTLYRISPIYAHSLAAALSILICLIDQVVQNNGYKIELTTLKDNVFSGYLKKLGFTEGDNDYVVSNYPHLMNKEAPLLKKIYSSLPLEYPNEIVADLNID